MVQSSLHELLFGMTTGRSMTSSAGKRHTVRNPDFHAVRQHRVGRCPAEPAHVCAMFYMRKYD